LDESAHACTRSELRGASCEDWKSAFSEAITQYEFGTNPEQRKFVIKTFYETNSLQQARVAFGLTKFA
jgi:hypothetical protein